MIFEELVLADVGPFNGVHHIPLAPQSSERPVVLFGGLNGAGKTTVLESLLLALYGAHTPGSSRRAGGYEKYLDQLINHDADKAIGSRVELAFRAVHEGKWRSFRVQRQWSVVGDRIRESVDVVRDGMPNSTLAEAWTDYVETLAPRGVANLFFFDGEQIEAFADLDVAKDLVRTAISGLLGLDLVDRLRDDLTVLERRKRQEAVESEGESEFLKEQQVALEKEQAAEHDARLALEQAQHAVAAASIHVKKVSERLAREGGERYQAADEVRADLTHAKDRKEREYKALVDALGGLGPLVLVEALLERTLAQADTEQRQADNRTVAAMLTERDTRLLDLLRGQRTTVKVQQSVARFLAEDLAARAADDEVTPVVGINPQLVSLGRHLLAGELAAERASLADHLARIARAQERLDAADRAAASLQQDWAVKETLEEHHKAALALGEREAAAQRAVRELQEATSRRQLLERTIEREFKAGNAAQLKSEESLRIVEYADRARDTLARLRAAATERHVKRIEALILDSLRSLLRKDRLITDVRIDPATCAVELLTHSGRPVRPRTLSAGERQLLAVALLAGLARASGRMLPVVIDTPLGRLDQDHRKRLIQRYLPNASHQVIVLSTDTEITPEVLDKLGDSISHMVKLEHDPQTRSSVVREGYFTRRELADALDEDDQDDEESQ
jgi:DNA sulfur modification protein DndD